MAAFDFPSSPNVNDIYTLNGVAFMWNGSVWKRYSTSTGAQGFQGAAGAQGAQGTNGTIGSDGAQGAQGHQGATGSGATGAQGAQGATGAAGAQGAPFDRSEYNYTASGGQTAFAAAYANASDVDVFMNGVRLTPAEYTASGGTTITLASGATAGDIIDILTFASAGPTGAQGAQGHQGDAFNRSESNFTATSGQTSFAPSGGYTNGDDLDVFVNGVRLTPADYTATNGTNVVLDVGANTGDIVDIIYYEAAGPAGAQGAAGIAGTVTFSTGAPSNPINGDLWYDTDDGAFAGYYDDGNTSQWIDLSGGPRGAQGAQGAAGSIPSNITAVNGTFSGNVSIGGTLTYEDVTNIDSVGVVTARDGIRVTGGDVGIGIDNTTTTGFGRTIRIKGSSTSSEVSGLFAEGYSGSAWFGFYSGSSTTDTPALLYPFNGALRIGTTNSVGTGGFAEKLRIDSDGRLLAGGATASNAWTGGDDLVIGSATSGKRTGITLVSGDDADGGIYWSDGTGASVYRGQIVYNHTGDRFSFYTAATERIRITSAGRMGVGTNDPNALLEVRDSENTTQGNAQIRISKGVGSGAAPASTSRANTYLHLGGTEWGSGANGQYLIGFGYTNDEIGTGIPAYIGFKEVSTSGYTHGDLIFGTRDTTTGTDNATERMRIDKDGHIRFGSSGTGYDSAWSSSNYGNTEVAIDGGGGYGALHFRGDGAGSVNTRFSMGVGDEIFYMCYDDVNARHNIMVNSSGHVRKPAQPAFCAYRNQSGFSLSAGDTFIFNTTEFNVGSHYNTSNGRFTAPTNGTYVFHFYSIYNGDASNDYIQMYKNGARINAGDVHFTNSVGSGGWDSVHYSRVIQLNVNDYVYMRSGSAHTYHGANWGGWSGYMLG